MVIEFDEISKEYRNKYLDWCFKTYDIKTVRKVFNSLIDQNMLCLELFMKMINIELSQGSNEIDHRRIRHLYKRAAIKYGRDHYGNMYNINYWNNTSIV